MLLQFLGKMTKGLFTILEDISGLTVELAAYRVEGTEPQPLHLFRLEKGEGCQRQSDPAGKLGQRHLSPGKHHIEIYSNSHTGIIGMDI